MQQVTDVEFRTFQEDDLAEIKKMIFQLYAEDPEGESISVEKIDKTINELSTHPDRGRIVVFVTATGIAGYAIVIYYWSNELGGDLLCIDELFVRESHRNKGIATRFLDTIAQDSKRKFEALQLEVTPSNQRALNYYRELGFETSQNSHLLKRL